MIDLHLHIDGSIPVKTAFEIIKSSPYEFPQFTDENSLRERMTVSMGCTSLNEYLEKFDLPVDIMQTEESITYVVRSLCEALKAEGVDMAELRFAPQLHLKKGLTQEKVVNAALRGVGDYRLILCFMRGAADVADKNEETLDIAHFFRKKGENRIAALDLAGAEALFPTSGFESLFRSAASRNIPFTIHAGEAAGPESIWDAISFGAARIGHGIAAAKDEKLMDYLARHEIVLEMCPTSNLQTKAVGSIEEYPLRTFLERGIPVTVNTDNMTVSGTTLKKEFELLRDKLGLTAAEYELLQKNAGRALFR